MGVQLEITHDLGESVPFHLRKREKDVLVGQQSLIAATRLLDRTVHDSLRRFADLVLGNVEVVHGTAASWTRVTRERPIPRSSPEQDGGHGVECRSIGESAR